MRRPALLAGGAVLALIGSYLACVLPDPAALVPGPYGGLDAVMQSGILEWTARHWHAPATWVGLPIFWPDPGALAYMDGLLGQALLVLPARPLLGGSAALGYDLALLGSLLLAALVCALLWRRGEGASAGAAATTAAAGAPAAATPAARWLAGGVAALALLGSPYTLSQIGHLNQVPAPPALLSIVCLLGAMSPVPAARRWAWGWGACLGLQAAWGWYGLAEAFVAAAVIGAWGLLGARGEGERPAVRLRRLAGPALLAGALVGVFSLPYWLASSRQIGFERSIEDVRAFSADLNDFLRSGAYRGGWLGLVGEAAGPIGKEAVRRTLNPGWVALALAVLGWTLRGRLRPRRRREGMALLAVGLAGLVLAFGDSVGLPGGGRRLPLPFGLLHEALPPLRAFRAAWRFGVLGTLAVAWWAGAGVMLLAGGGSGGRGGRWRPAVAAAAVLLLLVESWPAPLPAVGVPRSGRGDPLAALPAGAVLTLPAPPREADEDYREALWLHRALGDGHPVTGGATGWVPPRVRALRQALWRCETGAAEPDSLLRRQLAAGVGYAAVAEAAGPDGRAADGRAAWWRQALAARGWRALPPEAGITVLLPPAPAATGR